MRIFSLFIAMMMSHSAVAGTFSNLFHFGDSMGDRKNTQILLGFPVAPYADGRFTNGPNVVDHLSSHLGLPEPRASLEGGTNFGYGGSQTGSGLSSVPGVPVPNLDEQVLQYNETDHHITASDLVVIWSGNNNMFLGEDPATSAGELIDSVEELHRLGARRFLLNNLVGVPNSVSFNSHLASGVRKLENDLPAIEIGVFKFDEAILDVFSDPSFGFTNFDSPACRNCGNSSMTEIPNGGNVVNNPDNYVLWDEIHPTTAVHALLGEWSASVAMTVAPDRGDFNGDNSFTVEDLNSLSSAVREETFSIMYDMNEDYSLTDLDRTAWIESNNLILGDANFDGVVQFGDFLALSAGFGETGGWENGDFSGNGTVDFEDFLTLSENFGTSGQVAAVPEPSSATLALVAFGPLATLRIRSRSNNT